MTVDSCVDGLDGELRERLADSDVRVDEQYCLQRCGLCYRGAFVVVDGRVVQAADGDELEKRLQGMGVFDAGPER